MNRTTRTAAFVAFVVFIALSVPGAGAFASGYESCGEGPVKSVSLTGCGTPDCRDSGFVAMVLSLGDFRVGGYIDPSTIPLSLERILRLGFFVSVDVECINDGSGIDVDVSVVPVKKISSVKFKGNRHFWDSYLAEKLSLRVGDQFDPGNLGDVEILRSQENVIMKEYQNDGYVGTRVSIEAAPSGDFSVALTVKVQEGPRIRLKDVRVRMHRSHDDPGTSVSPGFSRDESCPVIDHSDLLTWAGVKRGSPLTEKTQPELVRALTARLRQVGYAGVKVKPVYDRDTGVLDIDVSWDSCWLIRVFAREDQSPGNEGYRRSVETGLIQELTFDESGIFDQSEAARGRGEIQTWYEDRGYLFADVVLDYRTRPRTAGVNATGFAPGVAGRITYFITTGSKAEIRDIRVSGNRLVKTSDIISAMTTKPYDFFGEAGAVMPSQIAIDLETVRTMYRERGFPDMKFNGTVQAGYQVTSRMDGDGNEVISYAGDTSAFEVVVVRDTEGVYLDISIDEGVHTTTGVVVINGNSFLSAGKVREILNLEQGREFSPVLLNKALRDLGRRYAREGFLKAQVTLSCEGSEPSVAREACNPADVRSQTVDLYLDIVEGPRTIVGEVFIEGAVKTRRSVILKDFPRSGDPYDVEKVSAAVRYLNNLGIFDSVRVDVIGADETPPRGRVALVIRVREAKSKFIDFALGLETLDSTRSADMPDVVSSILMNTVGISDVAGTGFGRSLGLNLPDILMTFERRYTDMNFLGRAKRLYLPVKYGLSFTAWDRYASFMPTYLDPNFFAKGLSFRVTPYAEYDRATRALDRVQFGAEFAISKEFVPRLFGSISFDTGVIRTRDPSQTGDYGPWRYENKLIPSLTYDGLDHPINPTKGFFAQASFSYINDVSEGNYLKYEFTGKAFFSIRKLVTFGVVARIGGSESFSSSGDLPLEERYTLGGNRGLRGFSTDGVGQYNSDKSLRLLSTQEPMVDDNGNPVLDDQGNQVMTTGYYKPFGGDVIVSGSFEVRFPLIPQIGLFGAAFYDFGALAETFGDLSGASFRHSVGVGIRYMLAGVVPIRLDYGIILDRRCKFIDSDTGQCEEREEFGNIHFGILYTF